MLKTKLRIVATALVTTLAVIGGELSAQQTSAPKPAGSAEMTETEAKLAKFRELVRPNPGEYVTNIAKIAWERDPWEAAVRGAKEGKPVIAYGPGMVGVPAGHG